MKNAEIDKMKTDVLNMVKQTIIDIQEYVHIFDEYDYIWLDDKQEHLENIIRISGNYFNIEENDLFNDTEHRQYKNHSISIFNEQVNNICNLQFIIHLNPKRI